MRRQTSGGPKLENGKRFPWIDVKGVTNKARYTATLVACGWAGVVLEKVTRASGQEPYAQKAQK